MNYIARRIFCGQLFFIIFDDFQLKKYPKIGIFYNS
jgi:hypothetical protein